MRIPTLFGALAIACALAACDRPGGEMSRTAPAEAPEPATAQIAGRSGPPVADARIALGLLNRIDEGEIASSQQLLDRGITGPLADFAQLLINQHREALAKTTDMGAATGGPMIDAQRSRNQAELDALNAQHDAGAYMNAYVAAMVRDHSDTLVLLDKELIPAADDAAVKEYLLAARRMAAAHLEQAQSLASARY